jgi:hypothetical protein
MTNIYLMPYHSLLPVPQILMASSGQFALVECAISANEWPYDNGDDPSFFVARRSGGPLTWGVCRQDVRTAIQPGSIVVFFSYTKTDTVYRYRMSAVATVSEKLDRRAVFSDPRFAPRADQYLNLLIRPENDGWKYDESDRHKSHRHPDWLWRVAEHGGLRTDRFCAKHQGIYTRAWFSNAEVVMSNNYVVFSSAPTETYISPNPPEVAIAETGEHERWVEKRLKRLTIQKASALHRTHRACLRSRGFGYVHPELRFELLPEEATYWRQSLISALQANTAL